MNNNEWGLEKQLMRNNWSDMLLGFMPFIICITISLDSQFKPSTIFGWGCWLICTIISFILFMASMHYFYCFYKRRRPTKTIKLKGERNEKK